MYEQFFEMKNTPFARDIPPEELYESPYVANALGRLTYAADRQLFAVVTADAGCGKSTLIRSFVASLPREEYIFLYLSDSKLTPRWFYKGLLDQLGIESKFYRGDAKRQLQKEVEIIRGVQKKKVVCILDEAHLLEKETIEEFRFLLLSLIENNNSYTQSEVILNLARKTVCKSYLSDKIEDNLNNTICYTFFDQSNKGGIFYENCTRSSPGDPKRIEICIIRKLIYLRTQRLSATVENG